MNNISISISTNDPSLMTTSTVRDMSTGAIHKQWHSDSSVDHNCHSAFLERCRRENQHQVDHYSLHNDNTAYAY